MGSKKGNAISYLTLIVVVLFALCCCTPRLGFSIYLVPPVLLSFILIFNRYSSVHNNREGTLFLSVLLYLVVVIFYKLLGRSSVSPGELFQHSIFFLLILMIPIISDIRNISISRKIFWLSLGIVMLNIVYNIYLGIIMPEINLLSTVYFDTGYLVSINAGKSTFYTMSLFMFTILFFGYLNSEGKEKKILLPCSLIVAIYVLFFCNKGTVVVYSLLSAVLLLAANRLKNKGRFYFMLVLMALVAMLIVTEFKEPIIRFIVSISPSDRLSMRLVMLIDRDDVNASTSSFDGRTDLYMLSFNTWMASFKNFLFGIGDHRSWFDIEQTGIGQHSEFLDTAARYGLLGIVLITNIIIKTFKCIQGYFGPKYKTQLIAIFFITIICGLTKHLFIPDIAFPLFMMLPLIKILLTNNTSKV